MVLPLPQKKTVAQQDLTAITDNQVNSDDNEDLQLSGSFGTFTTSDIQGNDIDETLFRDKKLTLVNVFATWCTPCVEEIPELEKLREKAEELGVGVAGIVMDTRDAAGKQDNEAIQKAQLLAEKSGAKFPFLIPDDTSFDGILEKIDAFPQTFFVDQNGNIVGETYMGARNYDDWMSIVEKELDRLGSETK